MQNVWDWCKKDICSKTLCIFIDFIFYSTIFIATNVPRVFITFVEGMHNMRFLFFIPNACTVLNCHFVHL